MEHLDLLGVVVLSTIISGFNTYRRYSRDWCGIRLVPSILLQNTPPLLVIIIVYFHLVHILRLDMFRRYDVLIYLPAALFADFLTGRLLRPQAPQLSKTTVEKLPALPVTRRITRKKLSVADRLSAKPDARQTLENAIETSDLGQRGKAALLKKLTQPPTKAQIFDVMNKVGLAHLKLMV
jgi:hypothetical protein